MVDELLSLLIEKCRAERNAAHEGGLPLDTKRALATTVTKLEEAQMWRDRSGIEKPPVQAMSSQGIGYRQ